MALEDYLHVVPEPLRDEFAPPRNAWKRHEALAFGDQRLTARTLAWKLHRIRTKIVC